ncbi:Shr3 amino acid permease chaperone [Calocera viscosa TUFC12733]|uniref:Shr3 amino acid permease chaperone n=1 Tax=Calocera viscosa (strain TUFC12733) TaxID=1330018 RepID=A0A167ISB3_CALVF|nr:Shr3 amino acid permease chaperone [Calocera viscosa TUFC12733]
MGFRQAALLCSICFFLGILFINFNVDHQVLFMIKTPKAIEQGYEYYTTFLRAPLAVKALMHTLMGVGLLSLVASFTTWTDSALFFDGTSIALYVCTLAMYISVAIPSIRTVVDPLPEDSAQDREEALGLLGAANVLMALLLVLILGLQAGQEYAKRVDKREMDRIREEEAKELAAGKTSGEGKGEDKKNQ